MGIGDLKQLMFWLTFSMTGMLIFFFTIYYMFYLRFKPKKGKKPEHKVS